MGKKTCVVFFFFLNHSIHHVLTWSIRAVLMVKQYSLTPRVKHFSLSFACAPVITGDIHATASMWRRILTLVQTASELAAQISEHWSTFKQSCLVLMPRNFRLKAHFRNRVDVTSLILVGISFSRMSCCPACLRRPGHNFPGMLTKTVMGWTLRTSVTVLHLARPHCIGCGEFTLFIPSRRGDDFPRYVCFQRLKRCSSVVAHVRLWW